MPRHVFTGLRVLGASLATFALAFAYPVAPAALSSTIVISQVYGGGGNSGATLTNDFIELFNSGSAPVSVTGWSVQYASSAGSTWQKTDLGGTIPPGGYYLVQEAQGAGGTVSLPTPDATGAIAMSGTSAKVALVDSATLLSGTCPGGVVDLVGFGAANCFEGAAATPALSNTTAALRNDSGCAETDNNNVDFTVTAPAPRNSASGLHLCTGATQPVLTIDDVTVNEGDSGQTTASFTVSLSIAAPTAVTFDIATADNTATTADGDYVAQSLAGQVIPAGQLSYTFNVAINGDLTPEPDEAFFVNVTGVSGALVGDGQGVGTITNDDIAPTLYEVVISQVYGGGGNSGATYTNDFVELFNRGATPVSLDGWSIQYLSAAGAGTWSTTALSGTIEPGRYYLIQEAAGAGGTTGLPTPDATGSIAMSGTAGKVLLRTTATAVSGACTAGPSIVDIVGYNSTASCYEGAPTGALSNTTAALRKRGGCYDSNDNSADFSIAPPSPRSSASPMRSCEYTSVAIHDIQGDGATTPYFGLDVTTTGHRDGSQDQRVVRANAGRAGRQRSGELGRASSYSRARRRPTTVGDGGEHQGHGHRVLQSDPDREFARRRRVGDVQRQRASGAHFTDAGAAQPHGNRRSAGAVRRHARADGNAHERRADRRVWRSVYGPLWHARVRCASQGRRPRSFRSRRIRSPDCRTAAWRSGTRIRSGSSWTPMACWARRGST